MTAAGTATSLADACCWAQPDARACAGPAARSRVERRGVGPCSDREAPDAVDELAAPRRPRRAWRRCGPPCPSSPSGRPGRRRGRAAAARAAWRTWSRRPSSAPAMRADGVEVDEDQPGVGRRLGEDAAASCPAARRRRSAPVSVPSTNVTSMPNRGQCVLEAAAGCRRTAAAARRCGALRAQAEHHRRDGAHARPERRRRLGALELGDRVLERLHGRVAVAAVEVRRPDGVVARRRSPRPSASRRWRWTHRRCRGDSPSPSETGLHGARLGPAVRASGVGGVTSSVAFSTAVRKSATAGADLVGLQQEAVVAVVAVDPRWRTVRPLGAAACPAASAGAPEVEEVAARRSPVEAGACTRRSARSTPPRPRPTSCRSIALLRTRYVLASKRSTSLRPW